MSWVLHISLRPLRLSTCYLALETWHAILLSVVGFPLCGSHGPPSLYSVSAVVSPWLFPGQAAPLLTGALLLAFLLFKSSIGLEKMLLRGVVCRHNRANVWIWFRFCALIENVLNCCYDSFHQTIAPWVPWTLCHMVNCIFYQEFT